MKLFISLFIVYVQLGLNAHANDIKNSFCSRSMQDVLKSAGNLENRLSFENNGGLFNGGVCWWHSRFERASDYLGFYRPDLQKPTAKEAKKLIHRLMLRRHVVEIPGYNNLREFSVDFKDLIQKQLNRWQIRDGLGNQFWVLSLSGKSKLPKEKLEKIMNEIFQKFNEYDSILTLMLQFKGIDSHMWNLIDMEQTTDGYLLTATDSNFENRVIKTKYTFGDTGLSEYYRDSYVPYPILNKLDLRRIKKARANFCSDLMPI